MKWSLEEIEFVTKNYKKLGGTEVAKKLNRPRNLVGCCYFNLRKKNFRSSSQYYARKPFKFPPLSSFKLGYLAGFIDGEGSLTLDTAWRDGTPRRCSVMVTINNKDPRPIEFIHKMLEIPWSCHFITANGLTFLSFSGSQRVKELLEHITPFLVLKKGQAEIVLKLLNQHKPRRWTLDDWKLVLKHAELNRADTHPSRIKRIKKLKYFLADKA